MDRATREEEREDIIMMKALGKMCIVVGVFIGLLFAAVCTEHTYSKDAIVTDVIGCNCVIVEDVDGYLWEVYADDLHIGEEVLWEVYADDLHIGEEVLWEVYADDLHIGEEVVVVLDDKHTAEIYDDVIIDIY